MPQIAWHYSRPRLKAAKRHVSERLLDFRETSVPIDARLAVAEAERCIRCPDAPCMVLGCPLHNKIPLWMEKVAKGEFREAARLSHSTNKLAEICGKLCPQERLCESVCVAGKVGEPIAIGRVEEFLGRLAREEGWLPPLRAAPVAAKGDTGMAGVAGVAIIGSGPSGLAAAEELALLGHAPVVFERWPRPGGVLVYGIPSFKLEKAAVEAQLARLEAAGVVFRCNVAIGQAPHPGLDELLDPGHPAGGFQAVLLATGASLGREPEVPGEGIRGVYQATEFLVRNNLGRKDLPAGMGSRFPGRGRCVVVGGGDTAMDCCRTAVRLGFGEVLCLYRRTEAEMPGRLEERACAREEGVRFEWLAEPVAFEAGWDGRLVRLNCRRMALGEPDASGRRRPVPVEGSEYTLDANCAVLALGYEVEDAGLDKSSWGAIAAGEDGSTSRPGVFAAGDAVNGADLIVTAVAGGRRAARAIHEYLGIGGCRKDEPWPT